MREPRLRPRLLANVAVALAMSGLLAGLGPVPAALAAPSGPSAVPMSSPMLVNGLSTLYAIACPGTTRCVATGPGSTPEGSDGRTVVISAPSGTAKLWRGQVEYPTLTLACALVTTCTGLGEFTSVKVSAATGATTTTHQYRDPGGTVLLTSLACVGSSGCYAVGSEGTRANSDALLVHLSPTGASSARGRCPVG